MGLRKYFGFSGFWTAIPFYSVHEATRVTFDSPILSLLLLEEEMAIAATH
jgi:hypothetical protein